jgi:hypothetical protein
MDSPRERQPSRSKTASQGDFTVRSRDPLAKSSSYQPTLTFMSEVSARADIMRQATFNFWAGKEIAARIGHDARADGGRRIILLDPRRIMIKRRLRGMKMHLCVPVENYFGVLVDLEGRLEGGFYRISLVHRDPELCVTLGDARNRPAAFNACRRWAAFFAKPALIDGGWGEWQTLDPPSAAFAPASHVSRRLRALGAGRRRFRLEGRPINRPANVFRGEREIICYE